MSEKQLLPSKSSVNAKNVSLFLNSELTGQKNLLLPERADNIVDLSIKFEQERNVCQKFCFYGMVESKWGDCHDLKIDFRIADSTLNSLGNNSINIPFWLYDKSSNISAYTWSVFSKKLDKLDGGLSKNIYGKRKAHYFFPFEIDVQKLTSITKSIYVNIFDEIRGLIYEQEFPFLYFDEDDLVLEYGTETAVALDDGSIIEIDNNYPYLYDRHWIRRELEPLGPAYVYFNESEITYREGGSDELILEDKSYEIDISLSKIPNGTEIIKLSVVYGTDENGNEYTTVNMPQDVLINFGTIEWQKNSNPVQTLKIKIVDDYFVESRERLTLQITPVIGVLPDPEKPQMISLFFEDNDIPSNVYFSTPSQDFKEPRWDSDPIAIPIKISLDRKLMVDNQSCVLYIDSDATDCESFYGFETSGNSVFSLEKKINFNTTDLEYTQNLYFISSRTNDIERKIVLKLRNFTQNVKLQSFNTNQANEYIIYVSKQLDNKYVEIVIPYDTQNGNAVMRSVVNKPLNSSAYNNTFLGGLDDTTTNLSTFKNSDFGIIDPNIMLSGLPSYTLSVRSLVFEQFFDLGIKNTGSNTIFNNQLFKKDDTIILSVNSGFTTSISSNEFSFNGKEFILKLPANDEFEGNFITGVGTLGPNGPVFTLPQSGLTWGFTKSNYEISISNKSYNYTPSINPTADSFKTTNLLTKGIYLATPKPQSINNSQYNFDQIFIGIAGTDSQKSVYRAKTLLKNTLSQYNWTNTGATDITSLGSSYSETPLFYDGIIILPRPKFRSAQANDPKPTSSTIFLSKEVVLEDKKFQEYTLFPDIKFLPIGDTNLPTPFELYQKNLRLNFGPMYIQAGVGSIQLQTITQIPGAGGATTTTNYTADNFILATTQFAPQNFGQNVKNLFLYNWNSANINTKKQAIIQIVNKGIVPATIFGKKINPNEKLWISESPIIPPKNSSIETSAKNVVASFDNLILDLPSNDDFRRNIVALPFNAFYKAKYEISFLNFKLYNYDGSQTNKIINKTINFEEEVNTDLTLKNFYLKSVFLRFLFEPTTASGVPKCDTIFTSFRKTRPNVYKIIINGFVATASVGVGDYDLIFSIANTINTPFASVCNKNGLTCYKITQP